jgi:hypothetical protein
MAVLEEAVYMAIYGPILEIVGVFELRLRSSSTAYFAYGSKLLSLRQ